MNTHPTSIEAQRAHEIATLAAQSAIQSGASAVVAAYRESYDSLMGKDKEKSSGHAGTVQDAYSAVHDMELARQALKEAETMDRDGCRNNIGKAHAALGRVLNTFALGKL